MGRTLNASASGLAALVIAQALRGINLIRVNVVGDGNCGHRCIASLHYGDRDLHGRVREELADYINANPRDFEALPGELRDPKDPDAPLMTFYEAVLHIRTDRTYITASEWRAASLLYKIDPFIITYRDGALYRWGADDAAGYWGRTPLTTDVMKPILAAGAGQRRVFIYFKPESHYDILHTQFALDAASLTAGIAADIEGGGGGGGGAGASLPGAAPPSSASGGGGGYGGSALPAASGGGGGVGVGADSSLPRAAPATSASSGGGGGGGADGSALPLANRVRGAATAVWSRAFCCACATAAPPIHPPPPPCRCSDCTRHVLIRRRCRGRHERCP
jgi:hypothetical protein